MIVGIGRVPSKVLEVVRSICSHSKVFVYPEFYDDKKSLVSGSIGRYAEKLMYLVRRGSVVIAVWPDNCFDVCVNILNSIINDVVWVVPIHRVDQLDYAVKVMDSNGAEYFLGCPGQDNLRNFSIPWFIDTCREIGVGTWLLGARRRHENVVKRFDGCDVTTMSIPGYSFNTVRSLGEPSLVSGLVLSKFSEILAEQRRFASLREIARMLGLGSY